MSLSTYDNADSKDTRSAAGTDESQTPFNNGGPSSSGVNGGSKLRNGGPGRSDNPLVKVQPPKREDLQPSYAQTLQGDPDAGSHGWYGGMSEFDSNI